MVIQQRPGDNLNVFCVFIGKATYSVLCEKTQLLGSCFAW